MHPVHSSKNHLERSYPQQASNPGASAKTVGLIRRWLGASIKRWQRRKMIAIFQAMDSRTLRDIGIERCDIALVVDGFDDHELRMVPLATSHQGIDIDINRQFRQAA